MLRARPGQTCISGPNPRNEGRRIQYSVPALAGISAFVGLLILHGVAGEGRIPSRPEMLTTLVDPFVGVDAGGNTVPGPQLPLAF